MDKWDKETLMWTGMWVVLAIIAAITLSILMYSYNDRLKTMAEKDYCETTVSGTSNVLWQKCK
jgi:hypothetical protein